MDEIMATAIEAVTKAGKISFEHCGKKVSILYKGEIDPVTEVDKLCEAQIIRIIRSRFPDHDILTEESSSERKASPYRWIIDPLDGTVNYAHGYPRFCSSVAFEKDGEIIFGAAYDPLLRELFRAGRGQGAYLNDYRLKVSSVDVLDKALLATGFPYDVKVTKQNNLDNFARFILRAQAVRRDGSAVLNLCYVAAGRFDGVWEMRMAPWDVAVGYLMVAEAGGKVTNFEGSQFDLYKGEVLATNGLIHAQMSAVLKENLHTG